VTTIRSRAAALPYTDIDTDQIIPARFLTSRTQAEFAEALFGVRKLDPEFVLNQPGARGREILLAGRNFGCGSSREQAVWALQAGGFRAVLAPSFGEIFASNALKNGLLTIRLSDAEHEFLAARPELELTVDLPAGTVTADGFTCGFEIDPFYRELLIGGLRELDYLLGLDPAITAYERDRINPVAAQRIGA
jgi:3-isopropylmalate/(R)-2-methylmalate dehydratase small subunit